MTDTENPLAVLSIGQQRRVKALEVSNSVMRSSGLFQSSQPKDATELVKLAEWVMNGTSDDPAEGETRNPLADVFANHNPFGPEIGVIELKGDELTGFLDFLANVGCGDPDCAVHGEKAQADEAGDDGVGPLTPEEMADEMADQVVATHTDEPNTDPVSSNWIDVGEVQSPAVNDHDERPTFN